MEELGLLGNLARQFEGGGVAMYPIVALGTLLGPAMLTAVIVAAVAGRSRLATLVSAGLLLAGAALVLLFALGGWLHMVSVVEEAIAVVNPEDAETIRAAGRSEALTLFVWALFFATGPFSLGVALSGLGLVRFFGGAKPAAS